MNMLVEDNRNMLVEDHMNMLVEYIVNMLVEYKMSMLVEYNMNMLVEDNMNMLLEYNINMLVNITFFFTVLRKRSYLISPIGSGGNVFPYIGQGSESGHFLFHICRGRAGSVARGGDFCLRFLPKRSFSV